MVFYNHIKGMLNDSKYFFIRFNANNYLTLGTSNQSYPSNIPSNLGEILTTQGTAQTIANNKFIQFNNANSYIGTDNGILTIKSVQTPASPTNKIILDTYNINFTGSKIKFLDNNSCILSCSLINDRYIFSLTKGLQLGKEFLLYNEGTSDIIISASNEEIVLNRNVNITGANNNLQVGGTIFTPNEISSGKHILAPYFVATSDKRYKENFKDLPSTLDFINSTKLYTFNYKSTPKDRNIGMIAQDVESTTFNDFNLVLDITSNGKSFKAIKETKLVYILWKGVQEESGKIKALEEKVAALEAKIEMMSKFFALPEQIDIQEE